MMISNPNHTECYVWFWLPGEVDPVVAGKLSADGGDLVFNYGKSYYSRDDAISIHDAELPLRPGVLPLVAGLHMPNCIRDAAPDAWGRRVIMNKVLGTSSAEVDNTEIDELTYLLESGSDRIGALDFQLSPTEYVPRFRKNSIRLSFTAVLLAEHGPRHSWMVNPASISPSSHPAQISTVL